MVEWFHVISDVEEIKEDKIMMDRQQQEMLHDQEFDLYSNCERLQRINAKIAALEIEKKDLTAAIIYEVGHEQNGQRSYVVGDLNVTCRTPVIYTLDKKAYESGDVYLDEAFDPVKVSTSYTINKSKYEECRAKAPLSAQIALNMLITQKPGKPSVIITS